MPIHKTARIHKEQKGVAKGLQVELLGHVMMHTLRWHWHQKTGPGGMRQTAIVMHAF